MEYLDDDRAALPRRPRRRRRSGILSTIAGLIIVGVLAAAGIWVARNPQPIIDQVTVWQYEPDAVIAAHVERLQLSDHGRFLYYASQPVVSSGDAFTDQCPIDHNEQEFGVLGCYVHSDKTIHLFDVTDPRLDGAEEVVAAHEMLHAAWDRMGDGERERLTTLLEAEFEVLVDDPEFAKRMDFYARHSPGQRANELHSIIGTEVANLSAELEEYYSQYFVDRAIVTNLHASSYAVFVELQEQADAIVSQLEALKASVEADYASYTAGYDELNSDIEEFNERAESGFYTEQGFTLARARLVARGQELDALYASITARVDQYDALTAELETVNETAAQLYRGLNIGGEIEGEVAPG
ncbi:hypothetical protein OH146_12950 [Salinibacterium sp. SYSU T00001]|uniref:hypothetical protein n=1 Tax=Homoserinimonas sedimenticola TaxID=2986805 RepID=UPI0022369AA2|nr:hypothetical protein [Salinibacterium sedimenticola]MCW4386682.1 hypothetical protein [Salinibacterium sedimenticola]